MVPEEDIWEVVCYRGIVRVQVATIVYCLAAFIDRDMYLEAIGYRGKNLRVIF